MSDTGRALGTGRRDVQFTSDPGPYRSFLSVPLGETSVPGPFGPVLGRRPDGRTPVRINLEAWLRPPAACAQAGSAAVALWPPAAVRGLGRGGAGRGPAREIHRLSRQCLNNKQTAPPCRRATCTFKGAAKFCLRGDGFMGTQTHLPPKSIFSSDIGHFILKVLDYSKKLHVSRKKLLKYHNFGGRPTLISRLRGTCPPVPPLSAPMLTVSTLNNL